LLEGDRQVEMGVRVERVQPQRLAVAGLRVGKAAEIVIDVPEVEVRLEEIGLERDRALVERLRLHELVAAVVNVREIDERGYEMRIQRQRLAIRHRSFLPRGFTALVER